MDSKKIGIRIADGTIYPVLNEEESATKRMILTTAKDNQTEIHAEIFRGTGDDMENPVRIGQLRLKDISPKGKGQPEFELVLSTDPFGKLNARIVNTENNSEEFLSVDLAEVEMETEQGLEDFSMPDVDFSEPPGYESEYEGEQGKEEGKPARGSKWLLIVFIIAGLAIIAGIVFLIFNLLKQPEKDLEAEDTAKKTEQVAADQTVESQEPSPEPAKTEETAKPETEIEEPSVSGTRDAGKPASETSDITPPLSKDGIKGGVWYSIAWGDTLWDLSNSFYRTPWLYDRIAAENNIEDPDYIFAGKRIYIPQISSEQD